MPWIEILWTDRALAKLAEHGVSQEEAAQVLTDPDTWRTSASSGRPLAMGWTDAGRRLVVVYEQVDDVTRLVITAYEPGL
jgi:uncharacterized DUF497 family protein